MRKRTRDCFKDFFSALGEYLEFQISNVLEDAAARLRHEIRMSDIMSGYKSGKRALITGQERHG